MTKEEELQARLQELCERQAQENRRNMETTGSLIEAFEQDLADRLRDSKMEETHRPKAADLQRLFADYKTQRRQERATRKQDGGR